MRSGTSAAAARNLGDRETRSIFLRIRRGTPSFASDLSTSGISILASFVLSVARDWAKASGREIRRFLTWPGREGRVTFQQCLPGGTEVSRSEPVDAIIGRKDRCRQTATAADDGAKCRDTALSVEGRGRGSLARSSRRTLLAWARSRCLADSEGRNCGRRKRGSSRLARSSRRAWHTAARDASSAGPSPSVFFNIICLLFLRRVAAQQKVGRTRGFRFVDFRLPRASALFGNIRKGSACPDGVAHQRSGGRPTSDGPRSGLSRLLSICGRRWPKE